MPFTPIDVAVERVSVTVSATGADVETRAPIAGSPFACRLHRRAPTVRRIEDGPGITILDEAQFLSFDDTAAPIREDDIATLPDGTTARLGKPRRYGWKLQADLKTGAARP